MTSIAEQTLAVQLEQAGIPFEREFRFAPEDWCKQHGFLSPTGRPRRWRADFRAWNLAVQVGDPETERPHPTKKGWVTIGTKPAPGVLVEIDGGGFVAGRHSQGLGMENDAEKASAAAILGYRVIRCTPRQVENGSCFSWIRQALGLEVAA